MEPMGKSEKSEPQMGFEPTTLRDLFECSVTIELLETTLRVKCGSPTSQSVPSAIHFIYIILAFAHLVLLLLLAVYYFITQCILVINITITIVIITVLLFLLLLLH